MLAKIKIGILFCFAALTVSFGAGPLTSADSNAAAYEFESSGAELYKENCARCHGADGTGGKGPNLASEKRQAKWRESDVKLVNKITKGGMFMPSFGKKLKAEEIKEIASYVRTLKE